MAREITEQDLANKGVSGLPDVPGLTTEAMQKKFDEISKELLVPRFNEMAKEVNEVNSNLEKVMSKESSNIFFTFSNERTEAGYYYSNSIYALTDITINSASIIGGTGDNMAPHIQKIKSGNYLYLYTNNADLAGKTVSCICSFV